MEHAKVPKLPHQEEHLSQPASLATLDRDWSESTDETAKQDSSYRGMSLTWEVRPTAQNTTSLFPREHLRDNLVRSEIDLTAATILGTTPAGPWVQNTFFHFPAALASTESHPIPRNPAEGHTRQSNVETSSQAPPDGSSYGSALSLDVDWPAAPISWTPDGNPRRRSSEESEGNEQPTERYRRPQQQQQQPPLTTTYEALEHIGSEEQTDAMLTVFLEGLAQGEPADPQQLWDPQLQAQDALLSYCKTIIGASDKSASTKKEGNTHRSSPRVSEKVPASPRSASTQPAPPPLASPPQAAMPAYWTAMKPVAAVTTDTYTGPYPSPPPLFSGSQTAAYSPPIAAALTTAETPASGTSATAKVPTDFTPLCVGEPQQLPPKELFNMNLLYQRPDVQLQRMKTECRNSKDDGSPVDSLTQQTSGPHPTTCKPCAFHWTKGCVNGRDCQFCHEWHAPKKKKPMKDQKNLMIIARPDGKIEFLRCSVEEALRRS